jgi:hypothetical protein
MRKTVAAVHRIAREQPHDLLDAHDVVDRRPLDVGGLLVSGAERRPPGTAEAVDRNAYGHAPSLRRAGAPDIGRFSSSAWENY